GLLQESRQAAILQHPAARLFLRAIGHHVVLEVHGLELRATARAWLTLLAVNLQRHWRLVGERLADHLLVVVEGAAQDLVDGAAQPRERVVVEVVALAERREPRRPEDL